MEAVKKRAYRFRVQAEGFTLSTPTSPFLKGLTPKSIDRFFGQFMHSRGSFGGFQAPQRRLKIPVDPTGKLKLHVFPLRRAKENKGLTPKSIDRFRKD